MNAPERKTPGKNSFVWQDPLLLEQQLTEQERMVRDAAQAYCRGQLIRIQREMARQQAEAYQRGANGY